VITRGITAGPGRGGAAAGDAHGFSHVLIAAAALYALASVTIALYPLAAGSGRGADGAG
jgi:hypothetical protein